MLKEGQFVDGSNLITRTPKSLYLFDNKNVVRKAMVKLTHNEWFNKFIMLVIFFNCVVILSYDHSEERKLRNEVTE